MGKKQYFTVSLQYCAVSQIMQSYVFPKDHVTIESGAVQHFYFTLNNLSLIVQSCLNPKALSQLDVVQRNISILP